MLIDTYHRASIGSNGNQLIRPIPNTNLNQGKEQSDNTFSMVRLWFLCEIILLKDIKTNKELQSHKNILPIFSFIQKKPLKAFTKTYCVICSEKVSISMELFHSNVYGLFMHKITIGRK